MYGSGYRPETGSSYNLQDFYVTGEFKEQVKFSQIRPRISNQRVTTLESINRFL